MTFRLPELDTSLGETIWVSTTIQVPSTTKLSSTIKRPSAIIPLQQNPSSTHLRLLELDVSLGEPRAEVQRLGCPLQ